MRLGMRYGDAFLAVLRRDAILYLSYRARFFSQAVSILFSLMLFYYVSRLVQVDLFETMDDYFAFVVVGILIFGVLSAALTTLPVSVRQHLVAGTFEQMLLSPFGPVAGIASMTVFPFLMSVVTGVVTVAIAAILFGLQLEWATSPLALPVATLGALAFIPFALLITAAIVAFKQAPGASTVVGGISIVAGLYFPVELLPAWIEWTSGVQPFTPAVDLLRHVLVGTPLDQPAWVDVAKLLGFSAVLLPISVGVLTMAIRSGQRRGTIIEY